MGKILIGAWDCKYCDKKAIPGDLRECPGCGNPRGDDVKFYLPNNAKVVNDTTKVSKQPDWLCSYCNTYNPDAKKECISCGHAREASDVDYFQHHNKIKSSQKRQNNGTNSSITENYNNSEDINNSEQERDNNPQEELYDDNGNIEKAKNNKPFKFGLLFIIIAIVVFAIVAICSQKTEIMKVEKVIWEYSMNIEKLQTVNESDWSLPENAHLQRTKMEIHHYESVIDHYENKSKQVSEKVIVDYEEVVVGYKDLGNGYFEEETSQKPIYEIKYKTEHYTEPVYREDPVYQLKYYYEVDKWIYNRTEYSNGFDKNPYWPEVELSENERISNKNSKYFVQLIDEEQKSEKIAVKYDEWCSLNEGDEVTVKVGIFSKKIVFD